MTNPPPIFDTTQQRRRIARAAGAPATFLLDRAVDDIRERLGTVQRRFERIVDVGTPAPSLAATLAENPSAEVWRLAPAPEIATPHVLRLVADPERLPLADGRFDLAVSAFALQTTNDLPGALVQIRRALKPDGLFLGTMCGGRTLHELRDVLTEAESEIMGGVSPRVAPFADVRDMGALLQRAGFALPVADSETVTVRYANLFALLADLRAMGATNTLVARSRANARRDLFGHAAALYAKRFSDADGRIRATFEIVSLSGWAPHESQQKPAKRGSATVSLAAALGERRDTD